MRCALLVLSAALLGQPDPAAPPPTPERFAAMMMASPLNPQPMPIEIGVDRWATDDTRLSLFDIAQSGGLPALLEAVKKAGAAGYVKKASHERLVAGYVQQEVRPGGGRRILMLCPRYQGDWEFTRDAGWTDHVFRIVALTLDGDNRGTGILFHAAKISFGKDGPDLVSELSGQPTRLLSVRKVR
jgi:hypothetical protein